MTQRTGEEQIFKMDRGGRVHLPRARREALLDEFERSGVSGPEFARLSGVKYPTFANWRAKRERREATGLATPRASVPFLEAVFSTPTVSSPERDLVVELPGGGRLLVSAAFQVPLAVELLRLLGHAGHRGC